MRSFFNGLILGIVLGAAGYWFLARKAQEHPETQQRFEAAAAKAGASASETAHYLSDAFKAKLDTLDLNSDQIKDEMARTGKIVRHKAQVLAGKTVDVAADAHIVAAIKAKYAADADLSVWKISVSCDQGHVALSGTVAAQENIGKAMTLALETEGVIDVTSTLTVKP